MDHHMLHKQIDIKTMGDTTSHKQIVTQHMVSMMNSQISYSQPICARMTCNKIGVRMTCE